MKQPKIRITSQNLLIPLSRIERAVKASGVADTIWMDIKDAEIGTFLPYEEDLLEQLQKAIEKGKS